jgi:hypothetical protein
MTISSGQLIKLDISVEQLLQALLELPAVDKIRVANQLRAAAAAERWQLLSQQLPDTLTLTQEEIEAEVKTVRKARKGRS